MIDNGTSVILLTLGGLFALGLIADLTGKRINAPRVSLLLMLGFLVGPSALDLLPQHTEQLFPAITDIAMVMVAFLLGQTLTPHTLRRQGRKVILVSVSVVVLTSLAVVAGMVLIGLNPVTALLFAGVATATDPVATLDVIRELRAKGPFSDLLAGVVAMDDAIGLLTFSMLLAVAELIAGTGNASDAILHGIWEILGAIIIGATLAVPVAYLTGRIQPGEPTQAEALGAVFLCAGLVAWLGASHILASMVFGAVIADRATHHRRPFAAIKGIEWPFMILFFLLAGSALRLDSLLGAGIVGISYIAFRSLGRVLGGWLGGIWAGTGARTARWIGPALLPQAGVALGMALYAGQRLPEFKDTLLTVVVGATVIFEILGPMITRISVNAAGEAQSRS